MDLAGIVYPRNAEHDHALGLDHALEDGVLLITRIGLDNRAKRFENLGDSLDELRLVGVLFLDVGKDVVYVGHIGFSFGLDAAPLRAPIVLRPHFAAKPL